MSRWGNDDPNSTWGKQRAESEKRADAEREEWIRKQEEEFRNKKRKQAEDRKSLSGFSFSKSLGDMSEGEIEKHISQLKSGATDTELSDEYYSDPNDPRPHGYEKLDPDLRILDSGVELTRDFADRLDRLNFGYSSYERIVNASENKNYKFTAFVIMNGSKMIDPNAYQRSSKVSDFFDGWSSSYHDAQWNGMSLVAGYGETPEEAISRRDGLLLSIVPAEDPSIKRFKLRRMVREGD